MQFALSYTILLYQPSSKENPKLATPFFLRAQLLLQSRLSDEVLWTLPVSTTLHIIHRSPLYHQGPMENPHQPTQSFVPAQSTLSNKTLLASNPTPWHSYHHPLKTIRGLQLNSLTEWTHHARWAFAL